MPRRGENIRKRQDKRWEGRYIVAYDEITGKARYRSVYAAAYGEVKKKLAAEKERGAVSYTHLDVYKRQPYARPPRPPGRTGRSCGRR